MQFDKNKPYRIMKYDVDYVENGLFFIEQPVRHFLFWTRWEPVTDMMRTESNIGRWDTEIVYFNTIHHAESWIKPRRKKKHESYPVIEVFRSIDGLYKEIE